MVATLYLFNSWISLELTLIEYRNACMVCCFCGYKIQCHCSNNWCSGAIILHSFIDMDTYSFVICSVFSCTLCGDFRDFGGP
jgi:hypothetical protein